MRSAEVLLRLLDADDCPVLSAEDLDGPHGEVIRAWQDAGFVATKPGVHPTPSCPHCGEGVPYRLGARLLCAACRSPVDPRHLLLWPLHRERLLAAVAARLGLRGGIQPIEASLWQLGTGTAEGEAVECFACFGGLPELGERRLTAYRRVLVFHGPTVAQGRPGRWVPLLELFRDDVTLGAADLASLLSPRGAVRFAPESGALWAGQTLVGEVPLGSREYHLLASLAEHLDRYVPYTDLKREILRRSGGGDEGDEATFCHVLKRRVKKLFIAEIDRLVVTTNKADGYRLRAYAAER